MKRRALTTMSMLMLLGNARAEISTGKGSLAQNPSVVLLVAFVALIAALCVVGSMRAKLKTARHQSGAKNYIVMDSLDLRVKRDRFLYRTVRRTKVSSK